MLYVMIYAMTNKQDDAMMQMIAERLNCHKITFSDAHIKDHMCGVRAIMEVYIDDIISMDCFSKQKFIALNKKRENKMNKLATLLSNAKPQTKTEETDADIYEVISSDLHLVPKAKGFEELALLHKASTRELTCDYPSLDLLYKSIDCPSVTLAQNLRKWADFGFDNPEEVSKEYQKNVSEFLKLCTKISTSISQINAKTFLNQGREERKKMLALTENVIESTRRPEKEYLLQEMKYLKNKILSNIILEILPKIQVLLFVREQDDLSLQKETAKMLKYNENTEKSSYAVLEIYSKNPAYLEDKLKQDLFEIFRTNLLETSDNDTSMSHWTVIKKCN